jgi:LPPG:FO 2-phospho-L-lactate transferase
MEEFNIPASVISIAEHYHSLIDGLVIDNKDDTQAKQIESMGLQVKVTNTIMKNDQDKIQLAQDVVAFAETINTKGGS